MKEAQEVLIMSKMFLKSYKFGMVLIHIWKSLMVDESWKFLNKARKAWKSLEELRTRLDESQKL